MDFNAERGAASEPKNTDAEEGDNVKTTGPGVKTEDPSLADMTRAALSILMKNKKGFFLFLEGKVVNCFIFDLN